MVYEDECEDGLSLTLSATGNLDASQTRQALHLGWKWPIGGEATQDGYLTES